MAPRRFDSNFDIALLLHKKGEYQKALKHYTLALDLVKE